MASLNFLSNNTAYVFDDSCAQAEAQNRPRRHGYRLAAGTIGDECEAKLWYSFRWVTELKPYDAKTLRVFEIGRYIENQALRGLHTMPDAQLETHDNRGRQFGVSFADGHGFGFLDGKMTGVIEAPKTLHGVEVKSLKNTDYNGVVKHGVRKQKPVHYAQMTTYMRAEGLTRFLYVGTCKNTSQVHFERVYFDAEYAQHLETKALRIAFAPRPPARGFDDPDKWPCMYCDHVDLCWKRTPTLPPRNCRTCAHVTPISGGKWICEGPVNGELDRASQELGCPAHRYIPDLVPGEIVETTEAENGQVNVKYTLIDGNEFIDGEQNALND